MWGQKWVCSFRQASSFQITDCDRALRGGSEGSRKLQSKHPSEKEKISPWNVLGSWSFPNKKCPAQSRSLRSNFWVLDSRYHLVPAAGEERAANASPALPPGSVQSGFQQIEGCRAVTPRTVLPCSFRFPATGTCWCQMMPIMGKFWIGVQKCGNRELA